MKILVVDNYDSFTYNLVQYLGEITGDLNSIDVVRNDQITLDDVEKYNILIISPGPGIPDESGMTKPIIERFSGTKPILGVCLGLQSIVEVFGGRLLNLNSVHHGVFSWLNRVSDDPIFDGIERPIQVGRYHSWVADSRYVPDSLQVTATDDQGEIMALRHRKHPTIGVQFHPESILTPRGKEMLSNFLKEAIEFVKKQKQYESTAQ